jgi:hypothetical protein
MASQVDAERTALEHVDVNNGIHHDTGAPLRSRRGDSPREDCRDGELSHLRFKLTGYRLYNILWPLAFVIAKAVESFRSGKPVTLTSLELIQAGPFATV